MILDRFLVTDQVAIVTASGRGIGAATAVALAEAGADVVLAARTEDQLREVAKKVEATGRRAVVVPGDLTDFDLMASLAETAFTELGRLDIVVNNMGGTMPRPLLDTSPRFLEEAFRFNVVRRARPGAGGRAAHARGRPPGRGHRQHLLGDGARGRPRLRGLRHGEGRRWSSTPGWPRATWRRASGSTPSASARPPPRRWTSSCRATSCAPPWRRPPRSSAWATSTTSRRRSSTWPHPPASYVTGKIIEVDGGLQSPNLEMPIPDL